MKKLVIFLSFVSCLLTSCQEKTKVVNPFETPVSCVKEYLDAQDSSDVKRMLNCYSYEPKYERILREGLEEQIEKREERKQWNPKSKTVIDSVVLKDVYPNSAIVTVYYTSIYGKNDKYSDNYDIDLVKDSTNWKLETKLSYSIETR